jgi:uncharacterized protein YdeI (BOF family)
MKTFGKITALAFVLFNTACEPEEIVTTPLSSPDNWKTVSIDANLTPEITDNGDGTMYLKWNGSATSNMESKINLSLSHEALDFDENESFGIQQGTFMLWTDDQQHTLSGTYTGSGYKTNGVDDDVQYIMEGYITIQTGTGRFAHENASLSFSIRRFFPSSTITSESKIIIRGKLEGPTHMPEM